MRKTMALVLMATLGCASRSPTFTSAATAGSDAQEAAVTAVIIGALNGEATGTPTDSLFTPDAVIVVNGRVRTLSPLFAGVGAGGEVAITSSQLEIRQGISWGLVEYRWQTRDGVAREGRATFLLTLAGSGSWRIRHVHSSSPR